MSPQIGFVEAVRASQFQREAKVLLEAHGEQVQLEWFSAAGASDQLSANVRRYAPRVDIAVGPFNTSPGLAEFRLDQICEPMKPWFEGLLGNPNPRCLVAIEVVYSGSAKHLLGDILNAGALGLFGLVVCRDTMLAKVHRNLEYLQALDRVGKLPTLFRNVRVISVEQFREAMSVQVAPR